MKNTVAGGGILLAGDPSERNVIRGNRNAGPGKVKLVLRARAEVDGNEGFEVDRG